MLSSEQQLVCLCARTKPSANAEEKIQTLVRASLNWDAIIATANRQGVLPLLYWNLNRVCPQQIPDEILDELRETFFQNAQRNLMLTRELLSTLELLRAQNISAIPFKGPLLAILAYGDLALRQIADLDLLVPKIQAYQAREILVARGYAFVHAMDAVQEKIFFASNNAWTMTRENPRVALDLHWTLTPKYFSVPLDLDAMRARLVSITLAGASVKTYSAEDLLLILCVHGARHVWERLDWLVSVAELVRAPAFAWDVAIARARAYRCERMVLLGLALAQQWLAAELPDEIQSKIRADGIIATLNEKISARLRQVSDERENFFEDTYVDELHPLMFERWSDRARYYAALIFSPSVSDINFLPLPPLFSLAYYLIRPIRLFARFGPRWLKSRVLVHALS